MLGLPIGASLYTFLDSKAPLLVHNHVWFDELLGSIHSLR